MKFSLLNADSISTFFFQSVAVTHVSLMKKIQVGIVTKALLPKVHTIRKYFNANIFMAETDYGQLFANSSIFVSTLDMHFKAFS